MNPPTNELINELKDQIALLVQGFEQETELLVQSEIRLVRGGCTDNPPYRISGVYLTVTSTSK